MKVNAILGSFPFAIETAMFQEIERASSAKFSTHARVGRRDAHQYLGPGDETITLPGYIMPMFTGAASPLSINLLREMEASGKSYIFIKLSAAGMVGDLMGRWVILGVDSRESEFFGALPQRIDFTLKLKRVDG